MGTYDPIAYTYEADYHCPGCAFERFGRDDNGFVPEAAEDSEGNPVGVIAPWDEWWNPETHEAETLVCGSCLGIIDETDATVPADYEAEAVDAYEECAMWTEEHRLAEEYEALAESDRTWDISEDCRREMASDVRDFLEDVKNLVVGKLDAGQVGHDFWLTRNGHGTGFWDRGLGELGETLTKRCRPYGEASLYVSDAGEIEYAS